LHTCPVSVEKEHRNFHEQSPFHAPLSSLPTFLFRVTSCRFSTFLYSLRLLNHPDVPLAALGCACMGDSPRTCTGHRAVLRQSRGENFPCPRACGFLPSSLLRHGTCHWASRVHWGWVFSSWCNGAGSTLLSHFTFTSFPPSY